MIKNLMSIKKKTVNSICLEQMLISIEFYSSRNLDIRKRKLCIILDVLLLIYLLNPRYSTYLSYRQCTNRNSVTLNR